MKRIMLVCLTALAVSGTYPLYAQSSESDFMAGDKSLFEEVTGIKKKTDKFNLYLNMHGDFNMKWNDSGFDRGALEMKHRFAALSLHVPSCLLVRKVLRCVIACLDYYSIGEVKM